MPRDSELKKRSVRIAGHETSITLEDAFWDSLRDIALENNVSVSALITEIDDGAQGNLSSAIRLYVLQHLLGKLAQ